MAEVDSSLIKQGFWINHAQGEILGATLTIQQRTSTVIIALVAIVVAAAAGSAWNLVQFTAHQVRVDSKPRDGLFRQQQALLRSLTPPGSVMMDSIKHLKAWKDLAPNATFRCLIPAIFGLVFALAALAFGIFSSFVVNTTDIEVQVAGQNCLDLNYLAYGTAADSIRDSTVFENKIYSPVSAYVNECYEPGQIPSGCRSYIHPRVELSRSFIECPFAADICLKNITNALKFDSGFLDSNDDFGLNAPLQDRVQIRRVATGIPLTLTDHVRVSPSDIPILNISMGRPVLPGEQFWVYEYGEATSVIPAWRLKNNGTTVQSTFASNMSYHYSVQGFTAYSSPSQSIFSLLAPIDALQKNDADVTVGFMCTNNVLSTAPINDPIYSAHQPIHLDFETGNITMYKGDHPCGAMGYTEQWEFCIINATNQRECTAPMGAAYDGFEEFFPSANSAQLATLKLFGQATVLTGLVDPLLISPPFIDANKYIQGLYASGVPDNQWMIDFQKMESWVWAMVQIFIVQHSTGFSEHPIEPMLTRPSTASQKQLCQRQKVIKPGGFANIHVFGLAFTLVLSAILITLDFGALRILIFLSKFKKRLSPGVQYWIGDGIYQMQRIAYEAEGAKDWTRQSKEIPVTKRGELLYSLVDAAPPSDDDSITTPKPVSP